MAAVALAGAGLMACGKSPEQELREIFASQSSGVIRLPSGVIELSSPLTLIRGSTDLEIRGNGTRLRAAGNFQGKALLLIESVKNITLREFIVDGNRAALGKPSEMAPPENAFRVWYNNNGVVADQVDGLEIARVEFTEVAHFPVIVSRSSKIRIHDVTVTKSGSKNAKGRNNGSGGILIEEGSRDFDVRNTSFRDIWGNGLWTHSLLTSPRLENGVFQNNRFETIGRDALQVGHAQGVRVEGNTGIEIGFPPDIVDVEGGGVPVAIDTAGDVANTIYIRNRFSEINGKCIDLDGFHDGTVAENSCFNVQKASDYPHGHFGIVMNNSNPAAHSNNIEIKANSIDGAKFGGLFVMGRGNRILNNHFANLNLARCNENSAEFGCIYKTDEPEMLQSGIYLGKGVARLEETTGNVIRGNDISGHQMAARCIVTGPGVSRGANTIESNRCSTTNVLR